MSDKSQQIILIDDDKSIVLTFSIALKCEGYMIESYTSGVEGLERIRKGGFDLLIVDYRMPDLFGIDLIEQFRRENQEIPILLMSASEQPVSQSDVVRFQPFEFEPKPVLPSRLRALVSGMLKRANPST